MSNIEKPIKRNKVRQTTGKKYFTLKRKFDWYFGNKKWALEKAKTFSKNLIFEHKSIILRPLKDVDMYLQENKKTNLSIAASQIHNVIIKPGETFSVWKLVGQPSKRKGYLEGLVLNQGMIDKDIGGGLCQLGNLLFWIFAHSPLTITERHRHGYDVFPDINRKVPFGAGATLSYNYIDFQVENKTDITFQIKLWLDETHLNGQLLSSSDLVNKYYIEERNHIFRKQAWGGYSRHNQIFQIEKHNDGTETEKLLIENHALMMYSPFLQEKNKI